MEEHQVFKASIVLDKDETLLDKKQSLIENGIKSDCMLYANKRSLILELIGWSRIDGTPIFRIIKIEKPLIEYFTKGCLELSLDDIFYNVSFHIKDPKFIHSISDSIKGYAN